MHCGRGADGAEFKPEGHRGLPVGCGVWFKGRTGEQGVPAEAAGWRTGSFPPCLLKYFRVAPLRRIGLKTLTKDEYFKQLRTSGVK